MTRPSAGEWLSKVCAVVGMPHANRLTADWHHRAVEDIGIGVDIEATKRFRDASPRLFTPGEWQHAREQADSLAGIWCAKEAVVKAIGRWQAISVRDVEVTWDVNGRPAVRIPGYSVDVTISHTEDAAVAVALVTPSP